LLDAAHNLGAVALAERAETELRATGAKPRRVMRTGFEALTASERRIAELAADGLTNCEIAQTLFVTARTVEGHSPCPSKGLVPQVGRCSSGLLSFNGLCAAIQGRSCIRDRRGRGRFLSHFGAFVQGAVAPDKSWELDAHSVKISVRSLEIAVR
jgi:hypothetical protein